MSSRGVGDDAGAEEAALERGWGEATPRPGGEFKAEGGGSSLVLQWLRLRFPLQGHRFDLDLWLEN